ncbi:MAG: UMP kinase [Nanoarchaeota archaeon]|nr:UMP kinase [Nanoarchaeota archaeon]
MKRVIISLGGSIIVPDDVDYKFLKKFKETIGHFKNCKIVVCTGGGNTARDYISILREKGLSVKNQDLIGIAVTRLNAKLLSLFLGNANKEIPTTLKDVGRLLKKYDLVVCGGLGPGQTSDGTTAMIAKYLDADVMINITNVDGLFDKNPIKYKDAKFIPEISHQDFFKIVSKISRKPGQHFVLDSLAAKICKDSGIKIVILRGMYNLRGFLEGKKFKGTIIK